MLRFLWWENLEDPQPRIVQYRFQRLVFGLTSSPAILNGTIQHHLSLFKESEPEVTKLLTNSMYVDDFPGGAKDEDAAFDVYQKAKSIMGEGGFNLRKWNTNSRMLKEKIDSVEKPVPAKDQGRVSALEVNQGQTTRVKKKEELEATSPEVKILGLSWNTKDDEFSFDITQIVEYVKSLSPTKRSLLKASAKIFDPIGLISPITVNMKIWFQKLCVDKINWDDELNDEWLKKWNYLLEELSSLANIRVPRCYIAIERKPVSHQVHGFSDASEKAFAAVVYLRTKYADGSIDARLIASKTRVAPLKKQSIPRLELLGACLLSKLIESIRIIFESLAFNVDTYYWVDSFTALCWIKNNKPWRQYVQHRVDEIRKQSDKDKWRFCPGNLNPADIPSRGCAVKELVKNNLWWTGPEFLKKPLESWPNAATTYGDEKADKELVRNPPVITRSLPCVSKQPSTIVSLENIIDMQRYSSKIKLLRVTAIVMKFVQLLKREESVARSKELNGAELESAEIAWIRSVQTSSFPAERQALQSDGKSTTRLKQFELYFDDKEQIRCQGRINNSTLPQPSKNPILLPSRHRFTELLIRERHQGVHHQGIRDTLNLIRQTHWILRGREAVKRVLRRCVICRRHEGRAFPTPPMPDLPVDRVDDSPPFTQTGVDFAGPLYVTHDSKKRTNKCYCCLFTCTSTRAIHLELTEDLTASSFLQAFRCFTSRRGLPSKLLSDNAKTFKAASAMVKQIVRSTEVKNYLTNKQVSWEFIMEKAPWWGGFWERMVRSVKSSLKKCVGRTSLTFEELRTLMVEIEATLNNRPLTYVYGDDDGLSYPLTPSDLVYGRHIATTPNQRHGNVTSTYKILTRRMKYHFRLLDNVSKQWHKEYLLGLREAARRQLPNRKHCQEISVGEIVIMKEDSTARSYWKLAKVEELLESKDGVVRAARIKVLHAPTGGKPTFLRRPIQHLIPLEVRCRDGENNVRQ